MCVNFKLQNALIDQPKAPNRQGDGIGGGLGAGLADKIIRISCNNDDGVRRSFEASPLIASFFYREETKKSAKKGMKSHA